MPASIFKLKSLKQHYIITFTAVLLTAKFLSAQKVDSIFFNLYTDSLKKGTYNYINVDGKLDNGRYLPMTTKELTFLSSAGQFTGNSLYIDTALTIDSVVVRVILKENPSVSRQITIYIKKQADNEQLKTMDEILAPETRKKIRHNKNGGK